MKPNVIKYLAVAVIAVVIIYITTKSGTLGPESVKKLDSDTGGNVEDMNYLPEGYLVIEAESAQRIEPPVQLKDGLPGASSGKCLYIGPEKVNEKPETRKYKRGFLGAANPGYAEFSFTPPVTALYSLWIRVRWSDDCGDSLDICFADKFFATIQGNSAKYNPEWIWLKAGNADLPLSKKLEKGKEYRLLICNREDDLYFDQILLIDSASVIEPAGILELNN
ncbi:MAG: hypothetical protein ACYTFY_06060 [Planctomycetota bacterium]|jgi:hypothetical protein